MNAFLGLDPGSATGGIAAIGTSVEAHPLPETERDIWDLLKQIRERHVIVYAAIEAVHSMPKQGVSSSFKFGRSYGFLRGLLIASGLSWADVHPQQWQKIMGCRTHGDKNISKARAQQLFPEVPNITHRTADALLLAATARVLYCAMQPDQVANSYNPTVSGNKGEQLYIPY
jgi:Holliday junction resolvasome RuvABC endonuclease subunit